MTPVVRSGSDPHLVRDFLRVPDTARRDDPHYVPPLRRVLRASLDRRANPYFAHASLDLLVAYEHGVPVGRLSVVVDPRQKDASGGIVAYFGNLEAPDDLATARALLDAGAAKARELGASLLEGPYSPNPYGEIGVREHGHDRPPAFFQPSNSPWIPGLLAQCGLDVAARFTTFRREGVSRADRADDLPRAPRADGLTIRPLDARHWSSDLERIRSVFNRAFADNWRFLPLDAEEYRFSSQGLRWVSSPDLVRIVECGSEPVGALLCALDVNPVLQKLKGRLGPLRLVRFLRGRRRVRRLVLVAVGVVPGSRRGPAFTRILRDFAEIADRFDSVETTWTTPATGALLRGLGFRRDLEISLYARSLA